MARKRRKKKPPARRRSSGTAPAAKSQRVASTKGGGARRYQFKRLDRFLAKGQDEKALDALSRLWPELSAERLDWVLVRWPQRAAVELAQWAEAGELKAMRTLLDEALLAMGAAGLETLAEALPEGWLSEARAVLQISAQVAQGDAAAKTTLRALGRRALFGHSLRFLRGLMAWYAGDRGGAKVIWAGLPSGGRLARGAARVASRGTTYDLLQPTVEALRAGQPSQAVRAAGLAFTQLDPNAKRMLARSLPGALMAIGVSHTAAHHRMLRGLPKITEIYPLVHLQALGAEAPEDISRGWVSLFNSGRYGPMGRAMILMHLTRKFQEVLREASKSIFYTLASKQVANVRLVIEQYYEEIIELDPTYMEAWREWIKYARTWPPAKRARLYEAYVKQHPDSPEALLYAGEACALRKAWDKGARYARRAMALRPLDREPRDLLARLLRGKARRRHKQGKSDAALALYQEATALPHQSHAGWFETCAELATAQALIAEDPQAARATKARALAKMPHPWLWQLVTWMAECRLRGGRWAKYTKAPTPEPPLEVEIEAVLALFDQVPKSARGVLGEAITNALDREDLPEISNVPLLRRLREQLASHYNEVTYWLGVQGARAEPKQPNWLELKYRSAMALDRPASAFKHALAEIEHLLYEEDLNHFEVDILEDLEFDVESYLQDLQRRGHKKRRRPAKAKLTQISLDFSE